MRRSGLVVLTLFVACSPGKSVHLEEALTDRDHAVILTIEARSGISAYAFGKTRGSTLAVDLGDAKSTLSLLVYEKSLFDLHLVPGLQTIAAASDRGQTIPKPDH